MTPQLILRENSWGEEPLTHSGLQLHVFCVPAAPSIFQIFALCDLGKKLGPGRSVQCFLAIQPIEFSVSSVDTSHLLVVLFRTCKPHGQKSDIV